MKKLVLGIGLIALLIIVSVAVLASLPAADSPETGSDNQEIPETKPETPSELSLSGFIRNAIQGKYKVGQRVVLTLDMTEANPTVETISTTELIFRYTLQPKENAKDLIPEKGPGYTSSITLERPVFLEYDESIGEYVLKSPYADEIDYIIKLRDQGKKVIATFEAIYNGDLATKEQLEEGYGYNFHLVQAKTLNVYALSD